MKRYGILPECVMPDEVDGVYAVEQQYWKSLWRLPTQVEVTQQVRAE